MKTQMIIVILCIIGFFFVSCDVFNQKSDNISDNSDNQSVLLDMDDLILQLSVEPAKINLDEEVTAVFTIRNNRPDTVEMVSGCIVLARGIVFKNDYEIGLQGSSSGCFSAISTHEIDPGEELEMEWQVKPFTLRPFPDDREPDTTFADPGKYTFTVVPDVIAMNGEKSSLPKLETTFVIE